MIWPIRQSGCVASLSSWRSEFESRMGHHIPDWCNGSTPDSESGSRGSNPWPGAIWLHSADGQRAGLSRRRSRVQSPLESPYCRVVYWQDTGFIRRTMWVRIPPLQPHGPLVKLDKIRDSHSRGASSSLAGVTSSSWCIGSTAGCGPAGVGSIPTETAQKESGFAQWQCRRL